MSAAVFLVLIFNASNWSSPGERIYQFPTAAACNQALSEMKIANEKPNSGVAVVAFCSPVARNFTP